MERRLNSEAVTALFHALIHLARLRWLGAAFCALAMLCVTAHATAIAGATAHARVDASASVDIIATTSASAHAQTKDRVWGFDQNSPLHVCALRSASAEQPSGISPSLPETASASSYTARGGDVTAQGIRASTAGASEKIIHFGSGVRAGAATFHSRIKPEILKAAGRFEGRVGHNPDIKVVGGRIQLQGTGPFKGNTMKTDLNASDFFGAVE